MVSFVLEIGDNEKSLSILEAGLFMICLDSGAVTTTMPNDMRSAVAHHVVYGAGSGANSINRWFDTAVQVMSQLEAQE